MNVALWISAAVLVAAGVGTFVRTLGIDALDEALLLTTATALAASGAFFSLGLTARPLLGLSLPLLAGWWLATAGTGGLPLVLLVAAAGGALAGFGLGLLASGDVARAAAATLALAVVADILSDPLAADRLAASPAVDGVAWLVLLALAAVALGWWSQGSLAAGLLHQARTPAAAAALGLRARPLVILACTFGGIGLGLAGAVLALTGAAPPSLATGLVLAAAAYAGGGTMAGTLALVAAIWLLPQLGERAAPTTPDLELWLAGAATAFAMTVQLVPRWRDDDA